MRADFFIGQGDSPLWSETLTDENGAPVLIQGATVTMTMTPVAGGTAILSSASVTNDDDGTVPNRGKVHRQFIASESATPGGYLVKVQATAAGKTVTFPNSGFLMFEIGASAAAQQRRYLSPEEFKDSRSMQGMSFADRDIDIAIESASRGLEMMFGGPWTKGQAGEQRFYTRTSDRIVALGDVLDVSSVDLDYSWDSTYGYSDPDWFYGWGGGTYATNLPTGSYRLLPVTNPHSGLAANGGDGSPFEQLQLSRASTIYRLPPGRDAIRVTGTFGWEQVPSGVKWAVGLVATRMMRRLRDAPWGVASFGQADAVATIRGLQTDPEFQLAMTGVAIRKRLFA